MFSESVPPELAAQLEACEVNAWTDMYAAMPADFAAQFGLQIVRVKNIVLTHCKAIPFVHFNCVKNFGMAEPASEELLDEVLAIYRAAWVQKYTFYHTPHAQPEALPDWFAARGLRQRGGWDRIY